MSESLLIKLQASACNFVKKETPAHVYSREFCEISKNTFSYRPPPLAAPVALISVMNQIKFNPLMPGGNKKVNILKGHTCFQLQVYLSMCDLFVTTSVVA